MTVTRKSNIFPFGRAPAVGMFMCGEEACLEQVLQNNNKKNSVKVAHAVYVFHQIYFIFYICFSFIT
jgi:hypothetical protein